MNSSKGGLREELDNEGVFIETRYDWLFQR